MAVIKGTTKSGIEYQLDSRIKDDARLLFLLTKAQKTDDLSASGAAMMDLLKLIFGSDDGVYVFMNAVADAHKGFCDIKNMTAELTEMFEALNAKN